MKLSRLTPVMFIVWLVFYMFGNNMLPITDPVESNYALTALVLNSLVSPIGWFVYQVLSLALCQ